MSYPDRKQVRHCLHKLGYGDIPDDQFELFIRDLKTLIQYERSKPCYHKEPFIKDINDNLTRPIRSILKKSKDEIILDENILDENSQETIKECMLIKNIKSNKTQFIRPWNLNEKKKNCETMDKSDPVTLYKNYQKQWETLKLPGQHKHQQIRWDIRSKMIADCPNPKPNLNRGNSYDVLNQRIKKKL